MDERSVDKGQPGSTLTLQAGIEGKAQYRDGAIIPNFILAATKQKAGRVWVWVWDPSHSEKHCKSSSGQL